MGIVIGDRAARSRVGQTRAATATAGTTAMALAAAPICSRHGSCPLGAGSWTRRRSATSPRIRATTATRSTAACSGGRAAFRKSIPAIPTASSRSSPGPGSAAPPAAVSVSRAANVSRAWRRDMWPRNQHRPERLPRKGLRRSDGSRAVASSGQALARSAASVAANVISSPCSLQAFRSGPKSPEAAAMSTSDGSIPVA
ncbi:MAG: hypothetical protein RLZZ326_389 [Planctomycetota bacterium]